MSEIHIDSTTPSSTPAPSATSSAASASAASTPSERPSKPAWPIALFAWGLIVALVVFEMAC